VPTGSGAAAARRSGSGSAPCLLGRWPHGCPVGGRRVAPRWSPGRHRGSGPILPRRPDVGRL